jgi:hypothetical protein
LTITDRTTGKTVITTKSDPIFEAEETFKGENRKLDSITVPIADAFIDPKTGKRAFSDDLVISTISGIITSDPPTGETTADSPETLTLRSFNVTFTSGQTDSLTVMGKTVSGKESGSIEVPARDNIRGVGDEVDLNSFTVSFTSDANLEPPPGIDDPTDGRNYRLTVALVSDGTVPEPSTWVMLLLGFAGLAYAGFRKANQLPWSL